ncbi:MAG: putative ABC exporter domain-containing protein [Algoriphagus sp.]|nr:putative ABC exporter domain-containing protein [Algoriphagus sp.]
MNEIRLLFRKDIFILINNIKLILRNPLRLIPYGAFAAYFFFIYTQRINSGEDSGNMEDLQKLDTSGLEQVDFAMQNVVGAITLAGLGILIFQLYNSTKSNVSFFKMADVNMLFTAPVKPANILIYYMARSILPALGGSILFIGYTASQMAKSFDLTVGNMAFLILAMALFFFMISPIRFLIYTLHTKYGVMEYIRTGVVILGISLSAMILIPGLMAEKFWQGMFSWIASPWFDFFPLVGWSRGIASYLSHQNLILSFAFIALYALAYFVVVKLVIQFAGYYYEDVLEATNTNEEKLEKVRGKKEVDEGTYSINSKKQLVIPDFGVGAKAFYWRNYVHSSRQDFHPLFGIYSLSMAGLGILFAGLSHFDWFSHKILNVYLILILGIYFMAGIGRTSIGDLKKPFFILIPARWTSKFWNMIKLDIIQMLLFAVALIVPSVLIAGLSLGLIPFFLIAILAFYLTGFAINLIPQVALEETWDKKLIKPVMIGGIFIFGVIPTLILSIIVFAFTQQFVWALVTTSIGMSIIAGILLHVSLDVLKRLEFREM